LQVDGVRIIGVQRHSRKLQRGAHRGNRFRIVLRELSGDQAGAEHILQNLSTRGVPNHFGAQRFGLAAGNLRLVEKLAAGARLDRTQRGFALSTARAVIFNAVLDQRIADCTWDQLQDGELAQLDGSGSVFGPITPDSTLHSRCTQLDIHPSGPLWGRGAPRTDAALLQIELAAAARHPDASAVCSAADLKQERRALRMRVSDLQWHWNAQAHTLELQFALGRGCFATALLALLVGALDAPEDDS
jgi:tRNA pseudouridine13 synthase